MKIIFEKKKKRKKKGLWANIHAKRNRGEKPAKPGDEAYPDKKQWDKLTEEELQEIISEEIENIFEVEQLELPIDQADRKKKQADRIKNAEAVRKSAEQNLRAANAEKGSPAAASDPSTNKVAKKQKEFRQAEFDFAKENEKKVKQAAQEETVTEETEKPPQPGESSGKAKDFKSDAQPVKKMMTIEELISQHPDIPYYKDVLEDYRKLWPVTEKALEYAKYLKNNPESVKNLPPIIFIDNNINDGAHRTSALYLLANELDKNNPFWKQAELKVYFYDKKDVLDTVKEEKSKFQKYVSKKGKGWKVRLLTKGKQSAGSAYPNKAPTDRAKSAPPGAGGV